MIKYIFIAQYLTSKAAVFARRQARSVKSQAQNGAAWILNRVPRRRNRKTIEGMGEAIVWSLVRI